MSFRIDGTSLYGSAGAFRGLLKTSSPASSATSTDAATQATARDDVNAATRELMEALGGLTVSKAKVAAPTYVLGALPSTLVGRLAHLGVLGGTQSILRSTLRVNTAATTARTSTAPLGLDLSPAAVSKLRSSVLGLDVISPTAPSRLASVGSLGLDVTSPAAASLLSSSQAIGLDLTSPNAPSALASSRALGLDVASPESASRLESATLGLDLTSPNAPSTLASAQGLGLDVASPETASVLRSSVTLGLDVTSPVAASHLTSAVSLGLDVTSPPAATSLESSSAIGLDLTSPDAPSVLRSSSVLGLDVASPAAPSRLESAALGLDLTSPDAPSALASSSALGLDVSSAETRSVLESSATLGLDVTSPQTSSTLRSTAEMNTGVTTAYGPSALSFPGSSSSGTLTGTYTGVNTAANATALTVTILNNANLNGILATSLKFEVRDQSNVLLFSFNSTARSGQAISLGSDIGLSISFAAGSLANGSTSTTTVTKTPISVDTTALFNAAAGSRPKFDGSATVTAGSFSINGTSITVNANDSINSVLSRINASSAGVTASVSGDKVTLTSNTASEDAITIGADTSGFVAATKLNGASTVTGNVRDDLQTLSKTTQFAGVTTGSFSVNGVSISVNAATDSVSSIVARINASSAGVTTSYDSAGDKLVLTSNANSEDRIAVSGDTSGFLSAAHLATGNTVVGNIRDDQQTLGKTSQFSSVSDGAFTINGVSIVVDKDTDSLATIVSRINSSAAGVTASYDSGADKLRLVGTVSSEDLIVVAGDTSGFLAAAKLDTSNTVRGHLSEDGVALSNLSRFASVAPGSFTVDGHSIAVTRADTIQSIVDKVNNSGARVTASFDVSSGKIKLATTFETEDGVDIGGDTSGFLTAAGIDAANTVGGNIADDVQVLAKTSQFASVASGSFTINGTSISVDRNTDSLADLVSRINGASAGVTATYDSAADKLVLTARANGEGQIVVGDDTTGFLSSAHLATANTQRGHLSEDGVELRDIAAFAGVVDGSFVLDGHSIAVSTTDSLNAIVDRINNSGARVTASYDAAHDRVRLDATYDSEDRLPIGSDTSGFLAAAHLDAANSALGNIADDVQVLAKTSQFGGVTDGSFSINGVSIAVDRNADSLSTLLARINSSGAGVTATFDAGASTITLAGNAPSEDEIAVDGDTSGFLAAAHLATGNTVRGNLADDGQVLSKTSQFAAVTSGSFDVNGATIVVDAARDSLSDVVARINASAAGVTAAYDASADRITLTSNANGEDDVVVGNDSTGFLAAAHLATANTERGNIRDDVQVLAKTSQFGGVADGTFTINGVAISVSRETDTLVSIIDRINNANAGVNAAYDAPSDTLVLAGAQDSENLIDVGNDTTGFLSAAHLETGNTTRGHVPEDGVALGDLELFAGVTPGSFVVDGRQIDVDPASDTIQTIVSKINQSGARVIAAYDSATDAISLTASYDSEDAVPIGGDTSGFLDAAGIDASNTALGNLRDDRQVLSKTTQFAAVADGSFSIDGTVIAIHTATDTLSDVIGRINASSAGVTASYDAQNDAISLVANADGQGLIQVGSDTSGFLAAAALDSANTVRGHLPEDGVALRDIGAFAGISAGSFTLDGATIAVDPATDTIRTIVDKINQSGARVTASYDTNADKLVLSATYDSEDAIPIGNDTSGFLAAARVDSANTVRGNLADDVQVLSKTAQFGGVTSGSFQVNGVSIAIDAVNDSLADVLNRITSSAAGVTATFDANSNAVVLTGKFDSEDAIVVGNDTTGFLAAAQLGGANSVRGNVHDDQQVLSKTTQFATVATGAFTVNGASIAVDVATDTFADIVDRINGAHAGVSASYDAQSDRLVLANDNASEELIDVGNDTSGFLAAAGLATNNTERGNIPDDRQRLSRTTQFAGVSTGSFAVNGASIAVDAGADSLADVLARVSASNAHVTASYDANTDTITFAPNTPGASLFLGDDDTGLLSALHVNAGAAALALDPAASFDATGLGAPMFDLGTSVHAGSFTVNGVQIDVAANDSVNSVLAKISASPAGVTAAYDAVTGTISLTATARSAQPITLDGDSSGFLAAVKLDGTASSVAGIDPSPASAVALSAMDEYGRVTAGTVTVNGTRITVDPHTTTIRDLLAHLNAVNGIHASVDDGTGKVTINATGAGYPLRISDPSNVLAVLGISTVGPLRAVPAPAPASGVTNASDVAAQVAKAARDLNIALAYYSVHGAAVEKTLKSVMALLAAAGARGVNVQLPKPGTKSTEPGAQGPTVVVDQSALATSLAAGGAAGAASFAANGGFSTAVSSLFDRFAAAAVKSATKPSDDLATKVKALLEANH